MPDFNTVNRGQSWSNVSGQNQSQRVQTGTTERPEAEIKLTGRKVELRTGARVTRARGPWVGFKRFMTASTKFLPRFMGGLSKSQQTERKLRHAEYNFDKNVNQLIEDIANNPDLTTKDVSSRLEKIAKQGKLIRNNSDSVGDKELVNRFSKNLNESLIALGRRDKSALQRVENAFKRNGSLNDLKESYTFYSDKDHKGLEAADKHDLSYQDKRSQRPMMTRREYVRARIVRPQDETKHNFVQKFVGQLTSIPQKSTTISREAHLQDLKYSLMNPGSPDGGQFKGNLEMDFKNDQLLLDQFANISDRPRENVNTTTIDQSFLNDAPRQNMHLNYRNGKSVNIRDVLKNENVTAGSKQCKELAVNELKSFVDDLKIEKEDQDTAIQNLSSLLNQHTAGSLDAPILPKLNNDGGFQPMNDPSTVKKELTVQVENGNLILTSRFQSDYNMLTTVPNGKNILLDSKSTNGIEQTMKLSVKMKDLVRQPLKFEILEANANVQLDLKNANLA